MVYINLIIELLIVIIIIYLFRKYLPSYFQEKGKNLATKEDIGEITKEIERVRSHYNTELEKLRHNLHNELEILQNRRKVYKDIARSMSVFISGRSDTKELKERFLHDYAAVWLWAPDEVVRTLNTMIDLQVRRSKNPDSVTQQQLKESYAKCILEMRKDCGFRNTALNNRDYKFVSF